MSKSVCILGVRRYTKYLHKPKATLKKKKNTETRKKSNK